MITEVVDMRTGLIHPRRDWDGRFLSRWASAQRVRWRTERLDAIPLDFQHERGDLHAYLVQEWNEQATR